MKTTWLNWRRGFVAAFICLMGLAVGQMLATQEGLANRGVADVAGDYFKGNSTAALNGEWEFYWGRLLTPDDFRAAEKPQMDSLIKVPSSWNDQGVAVKLYPDRGVATYRLRVKYPPSMADPALRIMTVMRAAKIYANGQLVGEVGRVSVNPAVFTAGFDLPIVALPRGGGDLELVVQVANLDYAKGGLREAPVFGSRQVLEGQRLMLLAMQLFFIGSVFIFSIYYFALFLIQRKNYTALVFSLLCLVTVARSTIWGEKPVQLVFPELPGNIGLLVNYITGYNLIPIVILLIFTIYPMEHKKITLGLVLLPTLFFEVLLFAPAGFRSLFNTYLYLLIVLQMLYVMFTLSKAVLHQRDNSRVIFLTMGVYVLAILADILHFKGVGGLNSSYVFLYGNFVMLIAMAYIQAKQQFTQYQKTILYNEQLIEADALKDKIMATEMSFLQAQIKPHFLYNALNAIANISEMDGKRASRLIVDLAVYLRGSLEFRNMDKMVTLDKEMELVDTYFSIEQARFGEKIQLVKELEISLDYQLPILIIEPLVENAVRHGISKNQNGGTVTIRMKQGTEGVCIEVEDDGVGFDQVKLTTILSDESEGKGVGLKNIAGRLLRLYGQELKIESQNGKGTLVRIIIPEGGKRS